MNQLDESFQKIERSFLKLILGTGGGIILLVVISVAGYRSYANWEEGHLLRRAAGFISGGDDKDAALTVRRALQLEPESVQGDRLMAEIAERAGDPAALDWRRKVLEQQRHSSSDLIVWANTAMQFDDLTMAKKALDRVDENGKTSAPFRASAARLATAEKRPLDAEAHWETAAKPAKRCWPARTRDAHANHCRSRRELTTYPEGNSAIASSIWMFSGATRMRNSPRP